MLSHKSNSNKNNIYLHIILYYLKDQIYLYIYIIFWDILYTLSSSFHFGRFMNITLIYDFCILYLILNLLQKSSSQLLLVIIDDAIYFWISLDTLSCNLYIYD